MKLTMKENKRLQVMQEVLAGKLTMEAASRLLEITERHGWRLLAAVKERGALGVIHGNRGRVSPRRIGDEVRSQVITLRKSTYAGFNDRHFRDELVDEEGIAVGREMVRKLLRSAGISPVKPLKKRKHRRRREPKERFGEMLQGDGSIHDWLEGRGSPLTLVHFVDDATNVQWAEFFYQETTEAYFLLMQQILKRHGLPRSLYVDSHSIFQVNWKETRNEELTGCKPLTHFACAMEELAIPIIIATSPQAKGRVERRGGLDQDRLVSELRKAKASTLEEARTVLKRYLSKSNRRFARKDKESAFIPLPKECDLKQILCWKEERVVANDNTISFHGKKLQIPKTPYRQTFAKAKVAVHLCLDGSVHLFHKQQRIAYFKKVGVDPEMVPVTPATRAALAAHSPSLTFSRGH